MKKERLDKLISSQSMMSRSEAVKLIRSGCVAVNNKIIKDTAFKAMPDKDEIKINGKPFVYREFVYIMLNKPDGIVSASNSPSDKTVIDILPEEFLRPGLFPAGRLDKDTTGFVLITDDGAYAHDILSPRHHIEKTYLAKTDAHISPEFIKQMEEGLKLKTDEFLPAFIELFEDGDEPVYKIVLCEGKYHQIKRMIAYCGITLLSLKRIKMGGLSLDEQLKPGEARYITDDELELITASRKIMK